ncbi:MAG: DUF2721 domain-containing protein [Methylococcales bacterium]|nr:DUF2721 domain-containing protein [Methylococcales bacterium]
MSKLDSIVHLITGSLVLFSSIGLFALTLNARYTHAIGRVREFYDDLQNSHEANKLAKELNMMLYRCHLLKWSFGLLLCSAISSGVFLLGSIFSSFVGNISEEVLILFVVFSVLFIFSSMIFLFVDVLASLKATLIHIERL